jgi:hypothetical protein
VVCWADRSTEIVVLELFNRKLESCGRED